MIKGKIIRRNILLLFLLVIFLSGCATTQQRQLQQAAIKNLETREVDAPYNQVFNAVEEVLFDWHYNITHSERQSGIIVGEKRVDNSAARATMIFLWGVGGLATPAEYVYTLSVKINPIDEKSSKIRARFSCTQKKISLKEYKKEINRFWVAVQREVMMETPLETNKTLKNNSVIASQVKDSAPTWIVNLETYKYKEDAYKRANILKEKGYKVIVRKVTVEGVEISQKETWYRISIVGFKNKQDAYKKIEDVKKYSPSAWIEKSQ